MSRQAPTYQDFVIKFPIFTPPMVSEESVLQHLNFAERLLCESAWGDFYSDGILLVAAHNLSMWLKTQLAPDGGFQAAVGSVNSSSGAGLSISFDSIESIEGSKSDAWYNRTAYGQEYLYLKSIVVPSASLSY